MRAAAASALLLLCACGAEPPGPTTPPLRLAALRDLLLYERSAGDGGGFFLSRFEFTRGRYRAYLGATGQAAPPLEAGRANMPLGGIDLLEARRVAGFFLCRVQRESEWLYASTLGGAYYYPWGNIWYDTRANTRELGIGGATLVGTFERGRSHGGAYDLIGNVAEWTETVDLPLRDPFPSSRTELMPGEVATRRTPALGLWLPAWAPLPADWLVQAEDRFLPRRVVGGSYTRYMIPSLGLPEAREWLPRQRGAATGLRLATTPAELLRALVGLELPLDAEGEAALQGFLDRPGHRAVLRPAWRDLSPRPAGPVAALLAAELGR